MPGMSGTPGPQRPQGREGEKGQIGDKGSQGMPGPRGDRRREGPPGKSGPPGIKGITGEPGILGTKGEQGIVGNQGRKGDKGEKGENVKASQASVVPQTNWKQCVWKSETETDNGKIKVNKNRLKAIFNWAAKGLFFLRGGGGYTHSGYHKTSSATIACNRISCETET